MYQSDWRGMMGRSLSRLSGTWCCWWAHWPPQGTQRSSPARPAPAPSSKCRASQFHSPWAKVSRHLLRYLLFLQYRCLFFLTVDNCSNIYSFFFDTEVFFLWGIFHSHDAVIVDIFWLKTMKRVCTHVCYKNKKYNYMIVLWY